MGRCCGWAGRRGPARAFDLATDPSDRLVIADRDRRVVERLGSPDSLPSCDDGDACTTDTSDPSTGCVHKPLGGLAGVTCSCARPLAPAACSGERVPPVVRRLFERACHTAGLAAKAGESRRGRRAWRHLLRDLHRAARRTGRAAYRRQLSPRTARRRFSSSSACRACRPRARIRPSCGRPAMPDHRGRARWCPAPAVDTAQGFVQGSSPDLGGSSPKAPILNPGP